MKRYILVSTLILLGGIWCKKPEEKVLARVGEEKITVGEFRRALPPRADSALKERILESMIQRALFACEAKKRGMDKDPAIEKEFNQRKRDVIVRALYREVVTKRVKVFEHEIKDAYKILGEELKLRLILLKDKDKAKEVFSEIKKGTPFKDIATKYSEDPSSRRGGDIGWIPLLWAKGDFPGVEKLKKGEVSKLIKTPRGFVIIKVEDKRTQKKRSLEEEKSRIKEILRAQKSQRLAQKFLEKIRSGVSYNPEAIKILSKPPDSLKPGDLEVWVAKKGKLVFKIKDIQPQLRRMMFIPEEEAVKQIVDQELLYREAEKRGLEKRKETQEDLAQLMNSILFQKLYREEVLFRLSVTDEEVASYYEEHKKDYPNKTLEDVKASIRNRLRSEKRRRRLEEYTDRLKAKYKVEVNRTLLSQIEPEER